MSRFTFPSVKSLKSKYENIVQQIQPYSMYFNQISDAYMDEFIFQDLLEIGKIFHAENKNKKIGDEILPSKYTCMRYVWIYKKLMEWEKLIKICKKAEEENNDGGEDFYPKENKIEKYLQGM